MATLSYRAGSAVKERFGEQDQIDINVFRLLIAASSADSRKLSPEPIAWGLPDEFLEDYGESGVVHVGDPSHYVLLAKHKAPSLLGALPFFARCD